MTDASKAWDRVRRFGSLSTSRKLFVELWVLYQKNRTHLELLITTVRKSGFLVWFFDRWAFGALLDRRQ
jgi:hypothetical protein